MVAFDDEEFTDMTRNMIEDILGDGHTHTHAHTRTHARTHAHAHTRTHTHTHTHTHTGARNQRHRLGRVCAFGAGGIA